MAIIEFMNWKSSTTPSGIQTYTQGRGPSVLMIGGGPGIGSRVYRKYLESSVDRFQWNVWDCRGTGESKSAGPFNFQRDLEDLREVIRHLRLDQTRYVLCGHSYGGFVAIEHVLSGELAPQAMVMVGSSADVPSVVAELNTRKSLRLGPRAAQEYLGLVRKLVQGVANAQDRDRFLRLEFQNHFKSVSDPMWREFSEALDFSFEVFLSHADWVNHDFKPRLASIQIPTLVFQSSEDTIVPASLSASLAGIPNVQFVDLNNCGHWGFVEAPTQFFGELESFAGR